MVAKVISVAVALLCLSGCGGAGGSAGKGETASAASQRGEGEILRYDFSASPLGEVPGVQVSSLAAAERNVPFKPVEPTVVQGVPSIFVTSVDVQPDWQMVVLVYRSSNYGTVQIFERAHGLTQAGLDQWSQPGYCTSCSFASSVVLTGGQRATVLGTPETTTAAHWIQDDFQIDVVGPYFSLTPEEATEIADDLSVQ